jgi:hypothetical protein
VLVIIQHFFKWIELASLQDKNSEGVLYAFWDQILSRLGGLA